MNASKQTTPEVTHNNRHDVCMSVFAVGARVYERCCKRSIWEDDKKGYYLLFENAVCKIFYIHKSNIQHWGRNSNAHLKPS